jgi:CDP-diacylglycerol--glycerol-3-phosphate 3-phosphatidyltransferase/cardiolipin synthase
MRWNIPNLLTVLRIALIPVFVGVFYMPHQVIAPDLINLIATLVFALASVTDWLDGYLARRWDQASAFGAFLDPVADKLMVAAALIVLVELGRVGAVVALIIIGREIAISALREWMAGIGSGGSVAVAMIGKIKTAAQMTAILFLLYYQSFAGMDCARIGSYLIVVAAILTLVSMIYYLLAARTQLRKTA